MIKKLSKSLLVSCLALFICLAMGGIFSMKQVTVYAESGSTLELNVSSGTSTGTGYQFAVNEFDAWLRLINYNGGAIKITTDSAHPSISIECIGTNNVPIKLSNNNCGIQIVGNEDVSIFGTGTLNLTTQNDDYNGTIRGIYSDGSIDIQNNVSIVANQFGCNNIAGFDGIYSKDRSITLDEDSKVDIAINLGTKGAQQINGIKVDTALNSVDVNGELNITINDDKETKTAGVYGINTGSDGSLNFGGTKPVIIDIEPSGLSNKAVYVYDETKVTYTYGGENFESSKGNYYDIAGIVNDDTNSLTHFWYGTDVTIMNRHYWNYNNQYPHTGAYFSYKYFASPCDTHTPVTDDATGRITCSECGHYIFYKTQPTDTVGKSYNAMDDNTKNVVINYEISGALAETFDENDSSNEIQYAVWNGSTNSWSAFLKIYPNSPVQLDGENVLLKLDSEGKVVIGQYANATKEGSAKIKLNIKKKLNLTGVGYANLESEPFNVSFEFPEIENVSINENGVLTWDAFIGESTEDYRYKITCDGIADQMISFSDNTRNFNLKQALIDANATVGDKNYTISVYNYFTLVSKIHTGTYNLTESHEHSYTSYNTNGNQHQGKCACGHTGEWENHTGGTATHTEQATCSVCGTKYGNKLAEIPTAIPNLVYNHGSLITGVNTGIGYTLSGHQKTEAGTYTATAALQTGYEWNDITENTRQISWEIEQFVVEIPTGKTGQKYDGTWKYAVDESDYYNRGAMESVPGEYTATINLISTQNYKWNDNTTTSKTINWSIIKGDKAAPTTVNGVACTTIDNNDGQITGVNSTMEYKLKSASEWISIGGQQVITGLSSGEYEVRYKETDNYSASPIVEVVINEYNHVCGSLTKTERVEPSHFTEGKEAYWTCSCGKHYEDENGTTLINNINIWGIIAKTAHQLSDWQSNGDKHWKECTIEGCDHKELEEEHVYDNDCDTTCNTCGHERTITHTYDNDCDTDCNVCGETRTTTHTYDNACDTTCNVCGETRTVGGHVYENDDDATCEHCGHTRKIVKVTNGTKVENADGTVTITANTAPEGKQFKGWQNSEGEIVSTEMTYTVNANAELTAVYEDKPTTPVVNPTKNDGLSGGAIAGIVIGSTVVLSLGGFAIFWFVIRKKSFAELLRAIKGIFKK